MAGCWPNQQRKALGGSSGSKDSVICGDREGGPWGVAWTPGPLLIFSVRAWEVVTWVCPLCDDSVGFFGPFSVCLFLHKGLKKSQAL